MLKATHEQGNTLRPHVYIHSGTYNVRTHTHTHTQHSDSRVYATLSWSRAPCPYRGPLCNVDFSDALEVNSKTDAHSYKDKNPLSELSKLPIRCR